MINSIKSHIAYKSTTSYKTICVIETDEKSINNITNALDDYSTKLDGIDVNGRTPTIHNVIMCGKLSEITDNQIRQVIPLTLAETDNPVWTTNAIALDGKWVGDIHPVTKMPMMYQTYRTQDKEFKNLCDKIKSDYVIVLKY